MMEFLEKNWKFLVFVSCFGAFVIYSVLKDRKKQENKTMGEHLLKNGIVYIMLGAFIWFVTYMIIYSRKEDKKEEEQMKTKEKDQKKQGARCMKIWKKMNERMKNMTIMDIGLVKWSSFFFAIIIVKLFPQLLQINYVVLIVLVLVCGIKPLYKFWIKK